MAASADGDKIVLHGLVGDTGITARPVVDFQSVPRAVLIAQAAAVAVQGEAGGSLGGPFGGSDVLLIGHSPHRYDLLSIKPSTSITGITQVVKGVAYGFRC